MIVVMDVSHFLAVHIGLHIKQPEADQSTKVLAYQHKISRVAASCYQQPVLLVMRYPSAASHSSYLTVVHLSVVQPSKPSRLHTCFQDN